MTDQDIERFLALAGSYGEAMYTAGHRERSGDCDPKHREIATTLFEQLRQAMRAPNTTQATTTPSEPKKGPGSKLAPSRQMSVLALDFIDLYLEHHKTGWPVDYWYIIIFQKEEFGDQEMFDFYWYTNRQYKYVQKLAAQLQALPYDLRARVVEEVRRVLVKDGKLI